MKKMPKMYLPYNPNPIMAIQWNEMGDHPNIEESTPEVGMEHHSYFFTSLYGEKVVVNSGDYLVTNKKGTIIRVVSKEDFEKIFEMDSNANVRYRTYFTELSGSRRGAVVVATDKTDDGNLLIAFAFGSGRWNEIDKQTLRESALLRLNSGSYDFSESTRKILNLVYETSETHENIRVINSHLIPVSIVRRGLYSFNLKEKGNLPMSKILKDLAKFEAERLQICWRKHL
jgi:hypothetical protein